MIYLFAVFGQRAKDFSLSTSANLITSYLVSGFSVSASLKQSKNLGTPKAI